MARLINSTRDESMIIHRITVETCIRPEQWIKINKPKLDKNYRRLASSYPF